ncbi:hypothetical protein ACFOGJ_14120 [Marinibaculum pumilum]|uniref:Uncharacterized protein n=1 Tax=Marinibaculum pumilum TaxID=1766165 RepID=A0ABV7L1U6_9PROT
MSARRLAATLVVAIACGACQQGSALPEGPSGFAAQRSLAQQLGVVRMAGVGDELVTLSRESGESDDDGDIMGRSGRGGMTVLTYEGLQDGAAVLQRRDVVIYAPEGQPRTFLDGGSSELRFDPAALPQTLVVDGVYVRLIEADRFILRFLLSRNRL